MNNRTYTTSVKENEDGELYIEIPQEILDELNWNENDSLKWEETEIVNDDDTIEYGMILSKVKKMDNKISLDVDLGIWLDELGAEITVHIGDTDTPNATKRVSYEELVKMVIESMLVRNTLISQHYPDARAFADSLHEAAEYAETLIDKYAKHEEFDRYFDEDDQQLSKKKKKRA